MAARALALWMVCAVLVAATGCEDRADRKGTATAPRSRPESRPLDNGKAWFDLLDPVPPPARPRDTDIALSRIARFFDENGVQTVSCTLSDSTAGGGFAPVKKWPEGSAFAKALQSDSEPWEGDYERLAQASFSMNFRLDFQGEIDTFVVYVDNFGFSFGRRLQYRFVNAKMARMLVPVFAEKGYLEGEAGKYIFWPMLKRAAGGELKLRSLSAYPGETRVTKGRQMGKVGGRDEHRAVGR